jgi:thiamine-monophosphate kinase
MKLKQLGEFGLIEKIRGTTPRGLGVLLGIGDDAAWLKTQKGSVLVTSDLLIEKVHFDLRWISFYDLGYKTLSANISDLAAMGGVPTYLVLSLGIPVDFNAEDVEEFYHGIRKLASECEVALVGGDTVASDRFFIGAFLMGHAPYSPITRSGAKEGDDLYVTGTLGDSALGLDLLKRTRGRTKSGELAYLMSRHSTPTARLKAGTLLAKEKLAKAMIDISDGLLQDLGHLCRASGVGAEVWQDLLPLSQAYQKYSGRKASLYALTGGENYELLFSLRMRDRGRLKKIERRLGVPITRIGKFVPAPQGIQVVDHQGKILPLPHGGFDHFRKSS